MAVPFEKPVISPILVGRAAQLEALERAVDGVAGGRGQTVLIAGEAGIGKSRLARASSPRAERLGFHLLEGHCFEPDRAFPYAPLLDLLRARFARRPREELARELGPAAPELAKLLPELTALLPGLAPTAPLAPEPEKRRLFQALVQFVAGLAAERPALVVVEDLHWGDDTSLEFLLHLARRLAAHPILLLLTYRSEEAHPGLVHFLAELDRGRLATELVLPRLDAADVDAMLRAIFALDRPVRPDFLHAVHALTEGNPFFVEEVLTSLIAAGDIYHVAGRAGRKELGELRIPRSVQDAVRRRSARLSEAARRVLALAAVAGRRFDFALLQALTRREEDELLRLIKELIGAQLVVEASAEQFAFRHALTRQAVYAELLARERQALHRQIAETLERTYADALDAHLEDLAYHFHAAGVWTKALAYAERAGDRARALYAPHAAVEQFTRALEAADSLSIPPSAKLHRGRGLAYETLGDFERAQADLEAALGLARAAGERPAEWQALLDLGLLWASRDYARTGDYYRRALTLARTMDAPAILAHSLNRLGNWHVNVERPVEGQRYHEEALAIFRGLDDRRGIAETLDLLGLAAAFGGDLVLAASYWEQAIALFRELGDRRGLASCLASIAFSTATYETEAVIPASIGHSDAIGMAEEALRIAREIGWRAGEALVLTHLPLYLGLRGDYARAFELACRGLDVAEDIEHRQWLTAGRCCLGALYLDVLSLPAARQHLEHALALAQDSGSLFWSAQAGGFLALACVARRDFARAGSVLDAALAPDTPAPTHGQRLALCARAELALARGDAGLALEIVDQLVASATNIEDRGLRAVPRLARLRGEALALLHRPAEAQAALEAAAEGAVEWELRSMLWRIHLALGKLYRAQRRREDAERELAAAQSIVNDLASELTERSLRDDFLQRAATLFPPIRPPSPRRSAKQAFGGLTEREREVAALVAQGKTNRQIAEALVVSEVTIVTHVGNILAKLGFSSRAQIAAWAVERGLAHIS